MKTTKILICAISIAAAVAAANASAQNISATLDGFSPFLPVNGTVDGGSFYQDYPSGVMNFTGPGGVKFDAFCVEPSQGLSFPETLVYEVQDSSLIPQSEIVAKLIGGYLNSINSLDSSQTAAHAAAVHWAIWEVVSDGIVSPSFSSGNIQITTPQYQSTVDLATTYLNNVNSYTPVALTYLTNGTRQDVVSWQVVPEPGTVGLLAFSALCFLRRRR
jgi:hypothetical protein